MTYKSSASSVPIFVHTLRYNSNLSTGIPPVASHSVTRPGPTRLALGAAIRVPLRLRAVCSQWIGAGCVAGVAFYWLHSRGLALLSDT